MVLVQPPGDDSAVRFHFRFVCETKMASFSGVLALPEKEKPFSLPCTDIKLLPYDVRIDRSGP